VCELVVLAFLIVTLDVAATNTRTRCVIVCCWVFVCVRARVYVCGVYMCVCVCGRVGAQCVPYVSQHPGLSQYNDPPAVSPASKATYDFFMSDEDFRGVFLWLLSCFALLVCLAF